MYRQYGYIYYTKTTKKFTYLISSKGISDILFLWFEADKILNDGSANILFTYITLLTQTYPNNVILHKY